MDPVVIIGSGLAGYSLARELRKHDRRLPLTIVSRDSASFYSKPMLSNAFAAGKSAAQLAAASADAMAAQLDARVLAHKRVESLDIARKRVHAGGEELPYSRLVLALGADPIAPQLGGDAAAAVLQVNDLADYARFRAAIEGKQRLALLGAGLIGCEFANDLRLAGFEVQVIDPAPRPLGRLLPDAAADRLRAALAEIGVVWHLGRSARALYRSGAGLRLELDDASVLEVDAVFSAIGLRPRVQLAQAAGLAVNRGIVADRLLRTSDPDVFALGDCAEIDGQFLPYVLPLMQAVKSLARTLTGAPTEIALPPMPVVVKTPVAPVVACPPSAAAGSWIVQANDRGLEARFEDVSGRLMGYALVGEAVARKQALTKLIVPAPR